MRRLLSARLLVPLFTLLAVGFPAVAQRHGRGYKPLPPTATVVVTVEKAFNGKPFPNASVVFRSLRDEKLDANLEMKTDPDGKASIDLLEVGSHVVVQVIAEGYATFATDFDLTPDGKQVLVKLQRPRAQISTYGDEQDRPAQVPPGVQEHQPGAGQPAAPTSTPPRAASPTAPLKTVPPANTPPVPPGSGAPPKTAPGNPQ